MFPLRDINPTRSAPVVVVVLMVLNTLVWLGEFWVQLAWGGDAFVALVTRWGMVPSRTFAAATSDAAPLTLLSHMFMHGGWMHFIGNMWFLKVFGDNVEDHLGHGRFLVFYLFAGLAAAAAQVAIDPTSAVPMVGASGAIAGVLAAYVVFHPMARVVTFIPIFFVMELPAFVFIFVWFGLQLLSGTASLAGAGSEGGVAFFAHIGGFVAGVCVALVLRVIDKRNKGKRMKRPPSLFDS